MDDEKRIEALFEKNSKSVVVTYLLWFFFGSIAAHRFYVGNTKQGIIHLLLWLIPILGWIAIGVWLLLDIFLIPGTVAKRNREIIEMINVSAPKTAPQAAPEPAPAPEPLPEPEMQPQTLQQPVTMADKRRQAMLEDLKQTGYRKERRDRNPLYR